MINQNAYFSNDSNHRLSKLNKKEINPKSYNVKILWKWSRHNLCCLGLELLEEVPDLDYIIVPISGKKQYILNKFSKIFYGKYFLSV